jgi:sec-independent protein translocase protein TatB
MFDFSWSEILLIGVVALVVIGPKELPRVLRTAGQWMGRARAVARDFQFQMDQLVRESELDDIRKQVTDVVGADPNKIVGDWVDPSGEIARGLTESELANEVPLPLPEPVVPEIEPELPLSAAPDPASHAPKPEPTPEPERPIEHLEPSPPPSAARDEVTSGTHG